MNKPQHTRARAAALATASLLVVAAFSALHIFSDSFSSVDPYVTAFVSEHRNEGLTRLLVIVTEFFSPAVMVATLAVLAAALALGSKRRLAALLVVSSALGLAAFTGMKALFRVARPGDGLLAVGGWSFPSGHATIATILFLFLISLFSSAVRSRAFRRAFIALSVAMIVAVSWSRVYLGVHWATDVAAGIALGTFCYTVAGLALGGRIAEKDHDAS